ncbi:VOC family protein [Croceitalea sp. MTPC9]|uniref:VOC family protein n=1 Tax=unclassified Croceitalea TaxID=2632280 RepID=UPI002B39E02F|nr:VOC family protein [Croceitalea sp. MTPC6]GMN15430.1 VOC family protein [Croceitalea sp. MTPC9]
MEQNLIGWIEIPVTNMARARDFYEAVFQIKITVQDFGGTLMGWLPAEHGKPGCSGSLILQPEWYIPNRKEGVLIYFSCKDVQNELDRIEAAGGRILKHKTKISDEIGFMGLFHDSEGNRIALHSPPE